MKWEKPKLLLLNNTEIAYGAVCSLGGAPTGGNQFCVTGPMAPQNCQVGDSAGNQCSDGGAPAKNCIAGGIG
jgi:hypothetical protein